MSAEIPTLPLRMRESEARVMPQVARGGRDRHRAEILAKDQAGVWGIVHPHGLILLAILLKVNFPTSAQCGRYGAPWGGWPK
jgi:hypothetical protein